VRVPPDVHRNITIKAAEANVSLNRFVSHILSSQ
jgi:predicted HicB family RNase H-like nuclease